MNLCCFLSKTCTYAFLGNVHLCCFVGTCTCVVFFANIHLCCFFGTRTYPHFSNMFFVTPSDFSCFSGLLDYCLSGILRFLIIGFAFLSDFSDSICLRTSGFVLVFRTFSDCSDCVNFPYLFSDVVGHSGFVRLF